MIWVYAARACALGWDAILGSPCQNYAVAIARQSWKSEKEVRDIAWRLKRWRRHAKNLPTIMYLLTPAAL
jgi:hypothetical protein